MPVDTLAAAANEAMRRHVSLPAWEDAPDHQRQRWRDAVQRATDARTLYEGYQPTANGAEWSELRNERRRWWVEAWAEVVRAKYPDAAANFAELRDRLKAKRQAEAVAG